MYKKQEWKDEIPDLSKPILDSTGKQKVDPQTGRPLWELVQEGTRITSARLNHMEDGIQAAHDSINNISQSLTPEAIGAAKKADLDTLQKNSVSIKTSTSKDFNTYREPGLYFIGSVSEYANAPSSDGSFSWGILRVEALGTTAYVVQSYTCVLNNVIFTRSKAEDSTGRGWELWRATSKLDSDGVLRLSKWLDIRSDGPAANLIGSTHVYQQFLLGDQRKGYVGAGDPKAPSNIALVSDHGDTVVNAKTNIWLNASGGAIHCNGRNILWEIDQLKTSGVNAKQGTVDALNAKGQPASANDEWPTLHQKIRQIYTGSPVARINIASSYDKRSFREHRSSNSGQSMYFVTVTGLGFRAKRIAIQSPTSSEFLAFYDEKWPNYVRCKNYRYGEYDYDMGVVLSDTFPEPNSNNGWWWQGAITPDGFLMPIGTDESNQGREVYVFAIG